MRSNARFITLSTHLDLSSLPGIVRRFFKLTGEEPWLDRREQLVRRSRSEPSIATIINTIYSRELAIADLLMARKQIVDFRLPSAAARPDLLEAYGFIATFVRIFQVLPLDARQRLIKHLLGALKNNGLAALSLELDTAAHLSRLNYGLKFNDLVGIGPGTFDFLAARNAREFEIDCKAVSADTGTSISYFGASGILSFAANAIVTGRKVGQTTIVALTTTKKISKRNADARAVAGALAEAIQTNARVITPDATVEISHHPSSDLAPFERHATVQFPVLPDEAEDWEQIVRIPDEGLGGFAFLFRCSVKSNRAKKIAVTLKDSVDRQFSKQRPAILFVRLADMTGDTFLRYLGQPTFMYKICHEELFKEKRNHLLGVQFLPGAPEIIRSETGEGVSIGGQVGLFIPNPRHPLSADPDWSPMHPPPEAGWAQHMAQADRWPYYPVPG